MPAPIATTAGQLRRPRLHLVQVDHRDSVLQTHLTAEGLQKRLTSLYYESIESEEEQGVNVLYLAVGFLKWFEDERSEVERYAPLVLLPVELKRKGARERFQIKARDEDLYTNISLKIWLAELHSIEFPELPDSDSRAGRSHLWPSNGPHSHLKRPLIFEITAFTEYFAR